MKSALKLGADDTSHDRSLSISEQIHLAGQIASMRAELVEIKRFIENNARVAEGRCRGVASAYRIGRGLPSLPACPFSLVVSDLFTSGNEGSEGE